jgi:glycosyltransferase involved in cell wall biosynthesis
MFYVELYSSVSTGSGLWHKINVYLYERFGFGLVDGILPISDYLIDFVRQREPDLPLLKVPMLTDFHRFDGLEKNTDETFFLFCGSAVYLEIIEFIMHAFDLLETGEDVWLYLVSSGNQRQMRDLNQAIARRRKNHLINVYSRISNEHLTRLYMDAFGLLIPLRPTIQDAARFPHKMGEYFASGNPVVTTNYGEVAKYFKDNDSALIAHSYSVEQFAEKMQFLLSNPQRAQEIGRQGKAVCFENFNYLDYGPKIRDFINTV